MTQVFVRERKAAAAHIALEALIPIGVAAGFGAIWWFVEDLPLAVEAICLMVVGLAVLFALKAASDAASTTRSSGGWRAEVSASKLKWTAPLPDLFPPIDLQLSEIISAHRVRRVYNSSDHMDEIEYSLELAQGHRIDIPRVAGMIDPELVFGALAAHGITYNKTRSYSDSRKNQQPDSDPLD